MNEQTNSNEGRPYSLSDVARFFGVSQRSVYNWVRSGFIPAPARLGRRVYWTVEDLTSTLAAHRAANNVSSSSMKANEQEGQQQ